MALAPACGRPVTPATLATLLEHEVWLTLRQSYTGTLLPDGGIQDGPMQVTLSTPRSGVPCYSFEGEVLLDGEPLELLWPAHYGWSGVPPMDTCFDPVWQMPSVLPERALFTLTARDESAEVFMTVPRIGAVRKPFLVAPDDGALSYGGSFTVRWSVPEDPKVLLDAYLETDAGLLFSTVGDTVARGGYDGGFEVFRVLSDGGEPLEGTLVLYGYPSPVIDCVPAELNCHADLAREGTQVPFSIQ
ncbi:MAG: hypothetical protein M3Y59_03555 [Myxococcota bacterium]|nr:hypothetical protein [Myxococcota bacterium]